MEIKNRNKLYWMFQGVGWGSFFITYSFIAIYFVEYHWKIVASYGLSAVVGFLITHFYRGYLKRHNWISRGFWVLAKRVFVTSILLAVIQTLIVLPTDNSFLKVDVASEELKQLHELNVFVVATYIFQFSIVFFGWSLIYFTVNFFFNYRQSEVEKWRLEAAVKDAELQALKSQINPHFIFNSLNNIRSLVAEDQEKAREMITHLSGLLRYSVQFNNQEKVSLEDELQVVKNYLRLESIQFEDRLQYKLDIGPETLEYKVPPMVVQMLVENAIKHGISNLPSGGEVNVNSRLEGDSLLVEVLNTGQLKDEVTGTGIGLRNASERLGLLFGKLSDLKIENVQGNMVCARFSIPIN